MAGAPKEEGTGNVVSKGNTDGTGDGKTESDENLNGVGVIVSDEGETMTSEKKNKKKSQRFFAGDDDVRTFTQRLSTCIFVQDVKKKRKMESLWKARPKPTVQEVYKLTGMYIERIQSIGDIDIHRQTAWTAE